MTEHMHGAHDNRNQGKGGRQLNEQIASHRPSRMFIEFACECADRNCAAPIVLTMDEFEGVRREPARFAVRLGHQAPALERLIETTPRYAVVEKHARH